MSTETMAAVTRSPFFEGFQPKHLDKLLTLASDIHFARDQVIFREGEAHPKFYLILSGRVALEGDFEGRTYTIQTLYAGDELGWSSVLHRRMAFRARALEAVQAVIFDAVELHDACRVDPYFGCAFLERMYRVATERLQETRTELLQAMTAR